MPHTVWHAVPLLWPRSGNGDRAYTDPKGATNQSGKKPCSTGMCSSHNMHSRPWQLQLPHYLNASLGVNCFAWSARGGASSCAENHEVLQACQAFQRCVCCRTRVEAIAECISRAVSLSIMVKVPATRYTCVDRRCVHVGVPDLGCVGREGGGGAQISWQQTGRP
jgi:hypothetical protein